ncbi:MAG: PepSY-associated TM helix domain-containing protein [bacterium]
MTKGARRREPRARRTAVLVHRWAGLALAGFLILAGLTGSLVAFHEELDRWLNPDVLTVQPSEAWLPVQSWVETAEAAHPNGRVLFVTLPRDRDDPVDLILEPREDATTGRAGALRHDQVFIDPGTGTILGSRSRSGLPLDRLSLVPFVYTLHYSLHLGGWGMWLLGGIALLWLFDSFVGLYLAWPRRTWKGLRRMLSVRWRASPTRVSYDLHRASGVWMWLLLIVLAFTGMSMNLHEEVFEPLVDAVSPMTPFPGEQATDDPRPLPARALTSSVSEAIERGAHGLEQAGMQGELGAVWIQPAEGLYHLGYHTANDLMHEHVGTWVSVSALDRSIVGVRPPGGFTLGDQIHDWQFPLHSGKAFGLAGRIVISASGLLVTILSVTGVLVWWRRRVSRRKSASRGPGSAVRSGSAAVETGASAATTHERAHPRISGSCGASE